VGIRDADAHNVGNAMLCLPYERAALAAALALAKSIRPA
jgi:hypothetical protein